MKQIKQKFIDYLLECIDSTKEELKKELKDGNSIGPYSDKTMKLGKRMIEIESLINMFKNESSKNKSIINGDLNILSEYIQASPLSSKEKVTLLIDKIKYNINTGMVKNRKEAIVIDPTLVKRYGVTEEDIVSLLHSGKYKYLLESEISILTEKERKTRKILEEAINESENDKKVNNYIKSHIVLEKHLLKKENTYTEEDIDKVINALISIEINKELCDSIKYILTKNLRKREKESYESKKLNLIGKEKINTSINDKEYKRLRKEISTYVDIYHMELKKELSEEEAIYCGHLLLKIGTDPNIVRTFFMRVENQKDISDIDPFIVYSSIYQKLKYYEEKLNLNESINTLNDYMMEVATNKEESDIWADMFERELTSIIRMLPSNYEYELEQASNYNKLIKRQSI